MVYRLKNWQLAIDIMRTDPDMMMKMIDSALEMEGLPPSSTAVRLLIDKCKTVTSQDGLEMCLTIGRDDLNSFFIGKTESIPEYENFLEHLDSLLGDVLHIIAQQHQLYVPRENQ